MKLIGKLNAFLGFKARNYNEQVKEAAGKLSSREANVNSTLQNTLKKAANVESDKSYKNLSDHKICHVNDVSYIHQGHINLCVDACIAMVMKFYKKDESDGFPHTNLNKYNVETLTKNPRGNFEGADNRYLISKLRNHDVGLIDLKLNKLNEEEVLKKLSNRVLHGPIVILYSNILWGHAVLMTGVIGDKIIIHDPWRGGSILKDISWMMRTLKSKDFCAYLAITASDIVFNNPNKSSNT